MRLPVRGVSHAVIKLITRVNVELETWAHWRLYVPIETVLHLHAHILVVVPGAQLLVQFPVVLRGIETLNWLCASSCCRHGVTSFAPKRFTSCDHLMVTYVAFMSE